MVYKHFLRSAVLPLCGLICLMVLLYFGGTYYTYQSSLSEMRERAKSTVTEVVRSEARSLNQKLEEVARNTRYLRDVSERLFLATSDSVTYEVPKLLQDDIYYRDLNTLMDGATIYGSSLPSSLYVSAETAMSEDLMRRLQLTEALDLHFQRTVDSNPTIDSVYFISWDNTIRHYPPVVDAPNIYRSGQQADLFKDYVLVAGKNNPDRSKVWTLAHQYPDAVNNSWIISSLAPVYRHGFMEGAIGVNLNVDNFTAKLLDTHFIWDSQPLLIDQGGQVLGVSEMAKTLLGVAPMTGNSPTKTNLVDSAVFSRLSSMEGFIEGTVPVACCLNPGNQEYLLSQQEIVETGWRLIVLTPINQVTKQVVRYQRFINNLGFYFIILTSIFLMLFFVYLNKQASRLAIRVSNPIEIVTDYISRLNKLGNNKPLPVMSVGIRELDRLIDSGTEIHLARSRLGMLNKKLEQKNDLLETLANTDRLTGLYNRHKLDEIIAAELEKAERYNNHFALALLDIDFFKKINDTYGHQAGDNVLIGLSAVMRRRMRKTDIVGRWGGEEFIMVLPNTSLSQARIVLDDLREQLSLSDFDPVKSLTVSIGLAHSSDFRYEDALLAAADEALYRAKNGGRNRVEIEKKLSQTTHTPQGADTTVP